MTLQEVLIRNENDLIAAFFLLKDVGVNFIYGALDRDGPSWDGHAKVNMDSKNYKFLSGKNDPLMTDVVSGIEHHELVIVIAIINAFKQEITDPYYDNCTVHFRLCLDGDYTIAATRGHISVTGEPAEMRYAQGNLVNELNK